MSDESVDKLRRAIGPPTMLELVYAFCTYISTASTWMLILFAIALGLTFSLVGELNYRLAISFVVAGVIFADVIRWLIWRRLRRIQHDETE